MTNRRRYAVRLLPWLAALVADATGAHAQAIYRVGGPQPVHPAAAGTDADPRVACAATGAFVATWIRLGASNWDVLARKLTETGGASTAVLPVNTTTTDIQDAPAVALSAAGDFVVAWRDFVAEGPGNGIGVRARRFTAGGAGGAEASVNSHLPGIQAYPAIARAPAGAYAVAWHGSGPGDVVGLWFRRFDAAGAPQGVETLLGSPGQYVDAAWNPATGGYVFAWEHHNGSDFDIRARRFDALGNPVGGTLEVNSSTAGDQRTPRVAVHSDGSFVVLYEGEGLGDADGILGQRFDAAGAPLGAEFWVNATTPDPQYGAALQHDAQGGFLVAWLHTLPSGLLRVETAYFSAAGARLTAGDFALTASLPAGRSQIGVDLCRHDAGRFHVVFSESAPAAGAEIYRQRLVVALFADGFESATTAAWSSTTP